MCGERLKGEGIRGRRGKDGSHCLRRIGEGNWFFVLQELKKPCEWVFEKGLICKRVARAVCMR